MDGRTERTRVEDYGRVARFRRWWRDWEGLFVGGWLILVSVAVIAVTVAFVSDQNATDRAARASCEQVRIFGPAIAKRLGHASAAALRDTRQLIDAASDNTLARQLSDECTAQRRHVAGEFFNNACARFLARAKPD